MNRMVVNISPSPNGSPGISPLHLEAIKNNWHFCSDVVDMQPSRTGIHKER